MVKQIFDEAEYRRRINAVEHISTGQELRLVLTGRLADTKAFQVAKTNAMQQVRREMRRAIKLEEERAKAANGPGWTAIELEYFGHQKEEIELVGL